MQKPAKLHLHHLCPTYPIGHQYPKPCLYVPRQCSHHHVCPIAFQVSYRQFHRIPIFMRTCLPRSLPALPHSPDRTVHSLVPPLPPQSNHVVWLYKKSTEYYQITPALLFPHSDSFLTTQIYKSFFSFSSFFVHYLPSFSSFI